MIPIDGNEITVLLVGEAKDFVDVSSSDDWCRASSRTDRLSASAAASMHHDPIADFPIHLRSPSHLWLMVRISLSPLR